MKFSLEKFTQRNKTRKEKKITETFVKKAIRETIPNPQRRIKKRVGSILLSIVANKLNIERSPKYPKTEKKKTKSEEFKC